MKRKLLFAMLCIVGAFSSLLNAQTWTASDVGEGWAVLYNVGTGQYLTRGNGWQTQASLITASDPLGVEIAELSGKYFFRTGVGDDASWGIELLDGGTVYTDQSRGKKSTWTFTEVGTDNGPVYNIVSADNHGGGTGIYLTANGSIVGSGTDGTIANAKWKVLLLSDLREQTITAMKAATETAPVDATGLIVNPNFSFARGYGWNMVANNKNLNGGYETNKVINVCAESWKSSNGFVLSQEINVPNGFYKVRAQAALTEYTVTGNDFPVIYAKSGSSEVTAVFNLMTEGENSMTGMATSFTAGKYFTEYTDVITVSDGKLTIGARGTRTGDTWNVWDNFQLQYLGAPTDLSFYENALVEAVTAAEAVEGTVPAAVYAVLNNIVISNNKTYSTVADYEAAISAINTATDEAKAMQAPYTRYKDVRTAVLAVSSTIDTSNADAKADAATTAEGIEEAVVAVRDALRAYLPTATVPAEGIDVTNALIDNPSVRQNTEYWTKEGTPNGGYSWAVCNFNECEFYQQNFKFFQTQTLPTGTWEFGVSGFHRAGNHETYFFAGNDRIKIPGVDKSVVDNMAGAEEYFNAGNGKVKLEFLLEEATNTIEIGIENNDNDDTDKWTIFRDFTLKYKGAPDYSSYATQLAEAVAAAQAVEGTVPAAIYNTLNDVVTEYNKTYSSKAEYTNAIQAIQAATETAKAMQATYDRYLKVKAAALALDDDASVFTSAPAAGVDLTDADAAAAAATDEAGIDQAITLARTATAAFLTANASNINMAEEKFLTISPIFLNNADFSIDQPLQTMPKGWDTNYEKGVQAENIGYQYQNTPSQVELPNGTTDWGYRNGDAYVSRFIEAWIPMPAQLGDGYLRQTVVGLPEGTYTLEADAISVQQDDPSLEITGAYIYINADGLDFKTAMNTGNGQPEHFKTQFLNTGEGDVVFGMKTESTNANWIAADNFVVKFYGVDLSGYVTALAAAVAEAQAVDGTVPAEVYSTLNDVVVANNKTYTSSKDYIAAIAAIQEATTAAKALQAPYSAYKAALADAQTALGDEANKNVTGQEKTDLEDAIASTAPGTTKESIEAATAALESATTAFTAAAPAYDAYVAAKEMADNVDPLPYALPAKQVAAQNAAATPAPTDATAANDIANRILKALRAYYESHAMAEVMPEAKDMSIKILNRDATDGNNEWTINGGINPPRPDESWTNADDATGFMYFDGGYWDATGWTTTMEQTINLAAGRYLLTAKGRASVATTLTMEAEGVSVALPNMGARGNVFDMGWNDGSVEFETTSRGDVTIKITATTAEQYQWFSVADFRLVQLDLNSVPATVTLEAPAGTFYATQTAPAATVTAVPATLVPNADAWSSSDESIFTINAGTGEITAVAPGTAQIIYSWGEQEVGDSNDPDLYDAGTATVDFTVAVPEVATVTLTAPTAKVYATQNIDVTITPDPAALVLGILVSDDETVAQINPAGAVEAVAPGTANISVAWEEQMVGDVRYAAGSATVEVAVAAPEVATVTLTAPTAKVYAGQIADVTITADPAALTVSPFTSDNTAVADVDASGAIQAVAPGTANISVAWEEQMVGDVRYAAGSATVALTVSSAEAVTISFANASVELEVGDSYTNTLNAPAGLNVTYGSKDPSVATVDPVSGKVTGIGAGSTSIMARWAEQTIGGVLYAAGMVSYTINVTTAPLTDDIAGFFRIKNNGNGKYIEARGRLTAVPDVEKAAAETKAGTIFQVVAEAGKVTELRSQGVSIPEGVERVLNYLPEVSTLAVEKLGLKSILGETGLQKILDKFNASADVNLHIERVDGIDGYRIYAKTPSMAPIHEFYLENKAQIDAKLPGLEQGMNEALNKLIDKIGKGESLRNSYSTFAIYMRMRNAGVATGLPVPGIPAGIPGYESMADTDPNVYAAKNTAFYQAVLMNEDNIWNFGYQAATMYMDILESKARFQQLLDQYPELKPFWEKARNLQPDSKYYIVQKDGKLTIFNQQNVAIQNNEANTFFTLEKINDVNSFGVNFNAKSLTTTTDGDFYYTTLYTDFGYELPADLKAYYINEIDGNGMAKAVEITGAVPAQTPVVLESATSGVVNISALNDTEGAPTDNLLKGNDFLINQFNIKSSNVANMFNGVKVVIGETLYDRYIKKYEYLMKKNSGTVNNKYFFTLKESELDSYAEISSEGYVHTLGKSTYNGEETLGFYKYRLDLNGNKAFLYLDGTTPVKGILFVGSDQTAIESLNAEDGMESIYDLSGRKVNRAQKGVYIVNGKKVLVK